jgi:hypothetical protein
VIRLLLMCVFLLTSSCAATPKVKLTAPLQDNAGTCAQPVLGQTAGPGMNLFLTWSGPDTGSVWFPAAPGQVREYERQVKPGVYTLRSWAEDRGGVGCDTTVVDTLKSRPGKPGLESR